ncbi:MAG TPA: ATP-binding protein, partial [Candidatus Limnocylindria bacterium]|nr:ATP-binding protein [Candidatus Limnocylindria bacterium]
SEEEAARITFDEDGPVRVRADPDRIEQIMANLLDNAVKFSAAGSAIEVSLVARGADAEVRVTDRGVGVPEAEQDRLFTTLFRTSRTADVAGTGLGLYISRRIAEQHRGHLRLESSSEKGSTFLLTLPLATPMPQG